MVLVILDKSTGLEHALDESIDLSIVLTGIKYCINERKRNLKRYYKQKEIRLSLNPLPEKVEKPEEPKRRGRPLGSKKTSKNTPADENI